MSSRITMNISLTPALEKFVATRLARGRYQTASEVVREGLRLLEEQERRRDETFKALKRKLSRAAAQAESGKLLRGEDVFADIRRASARRRKSAKK